MTAADLDTVIAVLLAADLRADLRARETLPAPPPDDRLPHPLEDQLFTADALTLRH